MSIGTSDNKTEKKKDQNLFESDSVEEALQQLQTDPDQGLSQENAKKRLNETGPNSIEEEEKHPLLKLLSHFWGPHSLDD